MADDGRDGSDPTIAFPSPTERGTGDDGGRRERRSETEEGRTQT